MWLRAMRMTINRAPEDGGSAVRAAALAGLIVPNIITPAGASWGTGTTAAMWLRNITLWPQPLSNAQIQAEGI